MEIYVSGDNSVFDIDDVEINPVALIITGLLTSKLTTATVLFFFNFKFFSNS